MKKTIALFLGLMLVFAFALVACDDEATDSGDDTQATEATETTEAIAGKDAGEDDAAPAGAVDWTQALDYEGEEVTITGEVAGFTNLFEDKGVHKYLIRLGGEPPEDNFLVVVALNQPEGTWPNYMSDLEGMLDTLVGKTVEVTGKVTLNQFESAYQIILNDADDDTLPDESASGTLVVVE